jgi:hypothetical protein
MVSALGPLFRTAGHTVRTQHGVTDSAGQRRGDVSGDPQLPTGPGWQPEPGLRPQHSPESSKTPNPLLTQPPRSRVFKSDFPRPAAQRPVAPVAEGRQRGLARERSGDPRRC